MDIQLPAHPEVVYLHKQRVAVAARIRKMRGHIRTPDMPEGLVTILKQEIKNMLEDEPYPYKPTRENLLREATIVDPRGKGYTMPDYTQDDGYSMCGMEDAWSDRYDQEVAYAEELIEAAYTVN